MINLLRSALVVSLLLGSANVYAACAQSDLTGTWFFNGVSGDVDYVFQALTETDACKLKFGAAGSIVGSSSSCSARDGSGKYTINITGGSFEVNEFCAVTGYFRYCVGQNCTRLYIDSARMDKGKTVISLVGRTIVDSAVILSMTGVKK